MDTPHASREAPRTLPAAFLANRERLGRGAVAMREKDYGIWQSYTWEDSWEQVRDLAHGLAALGFKRGDRICIVGDNRPQLYWGMLAAQALGGVPVPLYQDSIEREMQFIVEHAEARFALVEDQEQVDKFAAIKPQCPALQCVIYKDARGLRTYRHEFLRDMAGVQEQGRAFGAAHPDFLEREIAQGREDDLALICYTSGTTGRPKGVMLSHGNFLETSRHIIAFERFHDESAMAYLPMAWVGDSIFFGMAVCGGFTMNCPESAATVVQDVREIGPTLFFGPPRVWENLLTNVMVRMDDAAWIKRKPFRFFMDRAMRAQKLRNLGRPLGVWARLVQAVGNALVYAPLRDRLGMSRIRIAYTAGEAIGPETFDFFRAIGVNLKQLYGQTEASVFVALQKDGQVKPDTCGPPLPWVQVRISPAGEVEFKGPGVFKGYFKSEEATAAAFDGEWVRTGDAGLIDRDGHLKIIDRFKDVSRLADGTIFSPKYIENQLKFSPYIKEAVAVGMQRPYVAAMVNIDPLAVGSWAERHNLTFTSYADLARKPEVYDLVEGDVRRMNRRLAEDAELRGAQVRKFILLQKELDADDEEITRTRKLRRGFIGEKYKDLIEALFSDRERIAMEAKVTFEDGRTATVHAELAIRSVPASDTPGPAPRSNADAAD